VAPIGVIVAMDAELRHLLAGTNPRQEHDEPWLDHHLRIAGMPVVAMRSGMGMVNAAAAAERMIGRHRPRAILNFGCSGAHRRDIMPGDVIIGTHAIHHAAVHILASGEEHFVGGSYEVGGETMDASELAADPALLATARSAAEGWTAEPWPVDLGWPTGIGHRLPLIHEGAIASADVWTQSHDRLDLLHARHQTLCEEMEAAAIAQICARHQVPFLAVKDISNNEYHARTDIAGGFSDFPTAEVGKRAAALTRRVIERLAAGSAS
jgi:adenosylhomocysteine nucleosidase